MQIRNPSAGFKCEVENKKRQNQNKITDLKSVITYKGKQNKTSTIAQFLSAFFVIKLYLFSMNLQSVDVSSGSLGGNVANRTVSFAPRTGSCIVILDFVNQSRLFEGPTCLLLLMCVNPCPNPQRGPSKWNYTTLISNCISTYINQFTFMTKCKFQFKILNIYFRFCYVITAGQAVCILCRWRAIMESIN